MFKSPFYKGVFLIIILIGFSNFSYSQDLLKGKDLSQIKVDALSASDIEKLKTQLSSSGMSADQAEQMAISKGMPATEAAKLKQKIAAPIQTSNSSTNNVPIDSKSAEKANSTSEPLDTYKTGKPLINPLIFGSEMYTGTAPSFEPNLKMATPLNYILGPDDHISVTVYGVQEYNGDLLVSAEGAVTIPNVGQIKISGLTIEAATQKLKTVMGNSVYSYLKSGGSKISVTLSKIRSIKVTIIGSNRPGTYVISSLSTIFNALYIAGGPNSFGSFREIELVRNSKVERKIDLYRFLIAGDQTDNISLKDNDVIRIPAYKIRVELQGQFKRPGIFEILQGENFEKLLEYASGFTDEAYKSTLKITQHTEKEKQILNIKSDQFNLYKPNSGDIILVSSILKRFRNRVTISGAVYRPDDYELTPGFRILDLIKEADGLTSDAFPSRVQITRLQENLVPSIITVDLNKAIAGDSTQNILLNREDEILITSIFDLRDKFKITIQGEVRKPGSIDYVQKLNLYDAIIQAGGFTEASSNKIEIARILKRDTLTNQDDRSSIMINTEIIEGDINHAGKNILLRPFDVVTVRKIAGYQLPGSIHINGQVQFPGPYSFINRNERVSDIINRAGGFTPDAYPNGAYIKRKKTEIEKEQSLEAAERLNKTLKDSSNADTGSEILRESDKIPLDLNLILKNPGSIKNFVLRDGDEIYIPKFEAQVKVSGEVLLSSQVPYEQGKNFKHYINESGDFSTRALRRKSYIVYANGRASSTSHFLFFKFYPTVSPGSEIVVPRKRDKQPTSITEIVGLTTVLASLVTTYVLLKK